MGEGEDNFTGSIKKEENFVTVDETLRSVSVWNMFT